MVAPSVNACANNRSLDDAARLSIAQIGWQHVTSTSVSTFSHGAHAVDNSRNSFKLKPEQFKYEVRNGFLVGWWLCGIFYQILLYLCLLLMLFYLNKKISGNDIIWFLIIVFLEPPCTNAACPVCSSVFSLQWYISVLYLNMLVVLDICCQWLYCNIYCIVASFEITKHPMRSHSSVSVAICCFSCLVLLHL